jgi:hypothetical protein
MFTTRWWAKRSAKAESCQMSSGNYLLIVTRGIFMSTLRRMTLTPRV